MTLPRVSAAVMAHPARVKFVNTLVKQLDREATIVWDTQNDRWDTGRRALLARKPEATHHLVIQDDAVPCKLLISGLEHALAFAPADVPVSLFTGRFRPEQKRMEEHYRHAVRSRQAWFVGPGPWWGVAIVIPTRWIQEAIEFGDTRTDIQAYDRKLARFFASHSLKCWYTVPSLVDHRLGQPSLINPFPTHVRALSFIGQSAFPGSVDWTRL